MSDLDRPQVSRGLLIALGVVVVLALGWFLVSMLGGGDDEDLDIPVPRGQAPGVVLPEDLPTDGDDDSLYPETTEVFAARDPFAQLVSDDPAGAGGLPPGVPGGGTATPPPTGGVPGGGTDPGSGDGSGDGTDGGSGDGSGGSGSPPRSGSSAEVGGTRVKLVDVYEEDGQERALVTVNGRSYDVAEGEPFADRFRLLDLSGECGTFLFGDSRFVLCEGDEIRK